VGPIIGIDSEPTRVRFRGYLDKQPAGVLGSLRDGRAQHVPVACLKTDSAGGAVGASALNGPA
jgi:hypothetical protein